MEGGNDLLKRVGLQATIRVDPLLGERIVLHRLVDASKHTARHKKQRLKVTVVVDGPLRVNHEVIALDVEEPSGKVVPLVWPTPSSGTTVATTAVCTAGSRPSSKQEQHAHVGAHSGTNDATIVLGLQRCSALQPRLVSLHECTVEGRLGGCSSHAYTCRSTTALHRAYLADLHDCSPIGCPGAGAVAVCGILIGHAARLVPVW